MIEEVRDNTNNNVNKSRFTDKMLLRFFESASRTIQATIYNAYPQDMIFYDLKDISTSTTTTLYPLPSNMLAAHSIYSIVPLRSDGTKSDPLHRLSPQEVSTEYGYIIRGNSFQLTPTTLIDLSSITVLRVNYARKWKRLTDVDQTPEMHEILEDFMTLFVERKIHYVDSSTDLNNSNIFTTSEKEEMAKLYGDAARDPKQIPTGSDTYISY